MASLENKVAMNYLLSILRSSLRGTKQSQSRKKELTNSFGIVHKLFTKFVAVHRLHHCVRNDE